MKTAPREEKPTRDSRKNKIMIVDDEQDMRVMIQKMLEPMGFQIMLAENGSQFLEIIDSFHPDVVILDVLMPGPTTEKIFEKLKHKKSQPKIILLTVIRFSNEALAGLQKKGNIVAYITKPFDLDVFLLTVNNVMKKNIDEIRLPLNNYKEGIQDHP